MAFSHDNLHNYFKTNTHLKVKHGISFFELEEMPPFEREIYMIHIQDMLKVGEE